MRFRGRVNGLDPNSPRDFFSTDSLARLEWTFIYYWYLTVVMDPEALNFADAPLVELDWKGHTERNQQLFRYGFHWTLSEMVGILSFQRRPARTGTVWVSQVSSGSPLSYGFAEGLTESKEPFSRTRLI